MRRSCCWNLGGAGASLAWGKQARSRPQLVSVRSSLVFPPRNTCSVGCRAGRCGSDWEFWTISQGMGCHTVATGVLCLEFCFLPCGSALYTLMTCLFLFLVLCVVFLPFVVLAWKRVLRLHLLPHVVAASLATFILKLEKICRDPCFLGEMGLQRLLRRRPNPSNVGLVPISRPPCGGLPPCADVGGVL